MGKAEDVWLRELRSLKQGTRLVYRRNLARFMERFGVGDLEELFERQWGSLRADDPRDVAWAEGRMKLMLSEMVEGDFELWPQSILPSRRDVLENGYSGSSAGLLYDAVACFFRSQNVPFGLRASEKPRRVKRGRRIVLKDGVKAMWDNVGYMKHRNRAWMMTAKDTGFRVGDTLGLNVEDVLGAQRHIVNGEPYLELGMVVTQKMQVPAYPVLGPEAVDALTVYLGDREQGPLFLSEEGDRWRVSAASWCISDIADKSGLDNVGCHSFRIYFETQMQAAGVSEYVWKRWMGKAIKSSDDPYSQVQHIPGRSVDLYAENYGTLRVFSEEYELRERLEELEQSKYEMQGMRAEMQDMRERLDQLEIYKRLLKHLEE